MGVGENNEVCDTGRALEVLTMCGLMGKEEEKQR